MNVTVNDVQSHNLAPGPSSKERGARLMDSIIRILLLIDVEDFFHIGPPMALMTAL